MDSRRRILLVNGAAALVAMTRDASAQDLTFKADAEMESAIRSLVRLEIARAGVRQGTESAGMTDRFIRDGLGRFVEGGGLKDDLAISRALLGARTLGRELSRAAVGGRIGESTLPSIQLRICPLYPFC